MASFKTTSPRQIIQKLFNECISTGRWPTDFKIANTVTIPKLGKDDYSKVKNYRPIALLDVIGKWGAKLIACRLQSEAINIDLLHPLQIGGARQRGTTDAGVFLSRFVAQQREDGKYTSVLAVDVAQFFPSINHELLLIMLRKLGISPVLCHFFADYFRDRQTHYSWGNAQSDLFNASVGLPQGGPLSPILSDLYIALVLRRRFPWKYCSRCYKHHCLH